MNWILLISVILVVIVGVVLIVVFSKEQKNTLAPTHAPTSLPTLANTRSPTLTPTLANTRVPTLTPIPKNFVKIISIERNGNSPEINISDIKLFDSNYNNILDGFKVVDGDIKIDSSSTSAAQTQKIKAILNPPYDNKTYPASNAIDVANISTIAVVGAKSMPNPENYLMYGNLIGEETKPDHISYVPSIDKYVFMKVFGSQLKMVTIDNTLAKYTDAPIDSVAEEIFDPEKWSTYNSVQAGQSGYAVKQNLIFDPAKQYLQYIKIILAVPQKILKIMITNRLDCCADRIDGLICRTFNNYRTELSKTKISGSNRFYELYYNYYNGKNIGISPPSPRMYYPYVRFGQVKNFEQFWIASEGSLTQCQYIVPKLNLPLTLFGCNSNNDIFFSFINSTTLKNGNWSQIQNLSGNQITASSDYVIIKNSSNNLYYSKFTGSAKSSNWKQFADYKVSQVKIDTENNHVYMINTNGIPFRVEDIEKPELKSVPVPRTIKYISACNGKIVFVDKLNNLYYKESIDIQSVKIGGIESVNKVDIDRSIILVLDSNNRIFYTDLEGSDFPSNPTWKSLPGIFSYVSLNNGLICGITSDNKIYYTMAV